jgi:TPP-dependent pyruvate/acetoin dehydrogenase alpha subunit
MPVATENLSQILYRDMLLIRRTEEKILELFSAGKVGGTTHTCIGQEANAVALVGQLDRQRDFVVSNHRCHGHYLAYGGPLDGLLGEILGTANGVCGGRGGSQHIKYDRFQSNGVLGGGIPIACGIAMGEKLKGGDGITVVSIGDGALGEGTLYESLNMAALWDLPILFLVENNRYAQSTPLHLGVAGSIVDRARPFGIRADEIDTTDVEELLVWSSRAIEAVRLDRKPHWAVMHTYRFSAHSKGDDTRDEDEVRAYQEKDPLRIQSARLNAEQLDEAEAWVQDALDRALAACDAAGEAMKL